MDVFSERVIQDATDEVEIPVSYDEIKPTKSTDINPHVIYDLGNHDTLDVFEDQATFKPCKDQFINYLGFQAGYLQLTDLVDTHTLSDFKNQEQKIKNKLISPEKSIT